MKRITMEATTDYWSAVTDVPCPCGQGRLRWAEAGYVPGWRECDACGRQYQAEGNAEAPRLELRRGPIRRGRARARRAEEARQDALREQQRMDVRQLLYAVEHALPAEENGRLYHEAGVHGVAGLTGDDLPALREHLRAVQAQIGDINLRAAGPGDIADQIALIRRLRYPEAWAVYARLRSGLPAEIRIIISLDGSTVDLCCLWALGRYPVQIVEARMAALAAMVPDLFQHPVGAQERVAAMMEGPTDEGGRRSGR